MHENISGCVPNILVSNAQITKKIGPAFSQASFQYLET